MGFMFLSCGSWNLNWQLAGLGFKAFYMWIRVQEKWLTLGRTQTSITKWRSEKYCNFWNESKQLLGRICGTSIWNCVSFEFKFEFEFGILEVAVSDWIQILLQSFTVKFTPHFQFNASCCLNWVLLNPQKAFKSVKSSAWPSPRTFCASGCLIVGNLKVQAFLLTVMKDWCMWCFEAERLFLFLITKWSKILEV